MPLVYFRIFVYVPLTTTHQLDKKNYHGRAGRISRNGVKIGLLQLHNTVVSTCKVHRLANIYTVEQTIFELIVLEVRHLWMVRVIIDSI